MKVRRCARGNLFVSVCQRTRYLQVFTGTSCLPVKRFHLVLLDKLHTFLSVAEICVLVSDWAMSLFMCGQISFHCDQFSRCFFTVPLLSRVCPSDVCRIWKSGASLRVDSTLLGFENMTWIRGRRSYIFKGDGVCSGWTFSESILWFFFFFTISVKWLKHFPDCCRDYRFVCRVDGGQPWRWSGGHRALQHFPRNGGRYSRVHAASRTGSCQKVDYPYCQHLLGHQGYCFWEARATPSSFFMFIPALWADCVHSESTMLYWNSLIRLMKSVLCHFHSGIPLGDFLKHRWSFYCTDGCNSTSSLRSVYQDKPIQPLSDWSQTQMT